MGTRWSGAIHYCSTCTRAQEPYSVSSISACHWQNDLDIKENDYCLTSSMVEPINRKRTLAHQNPMWSAASSCRSSGWHDKKCCQQRIYSMMLDREAKNIWQIHVSTYNKQRLPERTAVETHLIHVVRRSKLLQNHKHPAVVSCVTTKRWTGWKCLKSSTTFLTTDWFMVIRMDKDLQAQARLPAFHPSA